MQILAEIQLAKQNQPISDRDKDAIRKRETRSESSRIVIPQVRNELRREKCLADPELFLRTYFRRRYTLQFGRDHRFMMNAIVDRAKSGGRQAIAAPRGRGKTEITRGLLVYIVLAGLVRFPLCVASTTDLAKKSFVDFKKKFATNDLLLEDFPEVCFPVRALDGAPQRAGRQHVDGVLTEIVWTGLDVSLPRVEGSPYGGVKMSYYGLDAAFRGANTESCRPDFVLIDDPETRESAKSYSQIADREAIIDQDIAGLASQEESLAIVLLSTVQNDYCLSYRFTDPKIKPAWNGVRFGLVDKWPTNTDHWTKYIELRHEGQVAGDRHGVAAADYYVANREIMDDGVEMLSDHYVSAVDGNGHPVVHSAIQQVYNKIADTSREAFDTEYQNQPPTKSDEKGNAITWDLVASRLSGLARYHVPAGAKALTAAIDLGKYRCHWVVIAWMPGATGVIIDYGVAEVLDTAGLDNLASEPKIYSALLNWRDELLEKQYLDGSGEHRTISHVFVDSGAFTNAAYEFVRQVQGAFHVSKGMPHYKPRKANTATTQVGNNLHREYQTAQKIWLYELNTDYWKQFVHERFMTPTFDENNLLRRGSLSLYVPEGSVKHTSFANHIAAEELVELFVDGKGTKRYWNVKQDNNHWLDATYMACACTELCNIKLLHESECKLEAKRVDPTKPKPQPIRINHGPNRFRTRPGGWVRGIRR